jgi:hypothetical protein
MMRKADAWSRVARLLHQDIIRSRCYQYLGDHLGAAARETRNVKDHFGSSCSSYSIRLALISPSIMDHEIKRYKNCFVSFCRSPLVELCFLEVFLS